jgi:tRNA uridine 5-carbamoylmethylation protein Kti12
MKNIRDLLARDLSITIEEVIKVDQRDEKTVHAEIKEYIFTRRIKEEYVKILDAISKGPGEPTEAVGVWVSGFFGSGKSSFAKNLGHVLSNRSLLGTPAGQLFIQQMKSQELDSQSTKIEDLVNFVNVRIPSHVIMFDVRVDQAVRKASESITEILYSVLLRELDYAPDYDVANLEIELEAEGKLDQFVRICAQKYQEQTANRSTSSTEPVPISIAGVSAEDYAVWRLVRKGAQKIQRTSVILNQLDSATYPNPDSWAQSLKSQSDITIRTLVERTFELAARRRPGQAIVFVIDELGAYVARSAEKIEHLRAVVEHFGQESKNRVLAGKAIAPVWVIITSQEKLDEVVAAIDDKRVELARLQDRFHYHINMAPADIREVATRRVLNKTPEGETHLRELYKKYSGQLKTHTQVERSQIKFEVSEDDFVQFYPYLPYFVELSIDIVSGMRLQAGAPRHYGGSNRTIIKQAYEMLVSERTHLADEKIGTLVTLDRIFDLMESNLPSERQRDITDIQNLWANDPWPLRTAKVIALLENVRGYPRTERNIAAVLYDSLESTSPLAEVERSIELLHDRQFIRQAEDGWKLLTDQEKSWATERDSLNPNPKERREIWEDLLRSIFNEPAFSRYQMEKRTFKLGVTWEGRTLTQGEIPLELRISDSPQVFDRDGSDIRKESREKTKQIFWALSADDELDNLVAELYRSKQMNAKYDQLRAQSKIKPDESASLANEKLETGRRETALRGLIVNALQNGTGFFDGVSKLGAELGKSASESLRAMLGYAVPLLYPKLQMGTRPIKGNEADEILKAANLNGLSKVFYGGSEGLELVVKEGANKYVVNIQAAIAKEVMGYLNKEHDYGNKVTGRMLEEEFGGLGYGWEREILWIVLASLLRAGVIEVTHQGRRYRNHLDAQVRTVFASTNTFRSASFAPRKAPDLKTLVSAAKRYEELTGDEVDVDESAIALAFQGMARTELNSLLSVEAVAKANQVPVLEILEAYRSTLNEVVQGASDDVVNILEGEGESFRQLRQQVEQAKQATSEAGINRLRRIRIAVQQMWNLLASRGQDSGLDEVTKQLKVLLDDGSYYRFPEKTDQFAFEIEQAYAAVYEKSHAERSEGYRQAIDILKGLPEWLDLDESFQASLLQPLKSRFCETLKFSAGQVVCGNCGAGLSQIESDIAAVSGLRNQALQRIQEMLAPEDRVERVRFSDVFRRSQTLATAEEVDELLEQLRDHLLKLIEAGSKVILE